jgi:hypothetical protein
VKLPRAAWQDQQVVKINGQSDLLVNINDRIVFLRLYNADDVTPITDLIYWKKMIPSLEMPFKHESFSV